MFNHEVDKGRKWFAIQTYTLKELVAKINFENQGFRVYLPQARGVRRHARRVDHVKKAFFPGYLFLHLGPNERQWHTIAGTRGAIRPVKFGEYYPPVPDWVIEELCAREDEKGLISLNLKNNDAYESGDEIKISLPNEIEHTGVFKALHGNERALILLDILQRQVVTIVPLLNLSPLAYC